MGANRMCDLISRKVTIEAFDPTHECDWFTPWIIETLNGIPSGPWMSFEEVAEMLSGLFGECACNVNGNDEWLPEACKYADTECPRPKEKNGCWMQFLMQGGVRMEE